MDQPEPSLDADPYVVLGVDRDADAATIKAAYRAAARRHHPDVGGDPAASAAVTRAYRLLRDAETRAAVDHRVAAAARAWEATRGVRFFGRLPARGWSALAWLIPVPAFPIAFFLGGQGLWTLRFVAAQSALWLAADGAIVGAAIALERPVLAACTVVLRAAAAAITLAGREVSVPGLRRPASRLADLGGTR